MGVLAGAASCALVHRPDVAGYRHYLVDTRDEDLPSSVDTAVREGQRYCRLSVEQFRTVPLETYRVGKETRTVDQRRDAVRYLCPWRAGELYPGR